MEPLIPAAALAALAGGVLAAVAWRRGRTRADRGLPGDRSWWLYVQLPGSARPKEYALKSLPVLIGRDPHLDISLPLASVSRTHARLEGRRGRFFIRDLGSTNGVSVGGIELRRGAMEIRPGQEVLLAGEVRLTLVGAEGPAGEATLNTWLRDRWT